MLLPSHIPPLILDQKGLEECISAFSCTVLITSHQLPRSRNPRFLFPPTFKDNSPPHLSRSIAMVGASGHIIINLRNRKLHRPANKPT